VHFWVSVSRNVISSYSLGLNILVSSVAARQGLRHILVRCSKECLAKFVYHNDLLDELDTPTQASTLAPLPATSSAMVNVTSSYHTSTSISQGQTLSSTVQLQLGVSQLSLGITNEPPEHEKAIH